MKKLFLLFLSMLLCSFIGCEKNNDLLLVEKNVTSSVSLKFSKASIPQNINYLIITMSRSGYDDLIDQVGVTGEDSVVSRFDDIAVGTWFIEVKAYDFNNEMQYSGSSTVEVIANNLTKVYLELNPVGGSVEIHVTWGTEQEQTFVFDFNSGDLSGWDGTASAEIVDGKLHVWEILGYWYHAISYTGEHFRKGTIEFDIKPGDGDYAFETKGGTMETGQQNWGIYMRWRQGTIQVNKFEQSQRVLVDTGVPYQPNSWYHIRINFDNDLGEKGKFLLWSSPIEDDAQEVYVGEFDYLAEYGKLYGVSVISTIVNDLNKETVQHLYYDNIVFRVTP